MSIMVLTNNPHAREREGVLIGGIRPELIRLAYEYCGDNLVLQRNSHFNPALNPDGHQPALGLWLISLAPGFRKI
jgi:hypothetical protein